jgi:microcystin-dependent protein
MVAGALIFIPGAGTFTVIGAPIDQNRVQIQNSGDPANTPCGTMVGAGGSVSAANLRGPTGGQGIAGPTGPPGPQGVAGASAFSTLAQAYTVPATGASAVAFVQNAASFSAGQIVYIQGGDYFSVQSVNTTNNSLVLVNQGYPGGAPQGTVLPAGNNVSGTGPQGPIGPVGPVGPAGPQGLIGVAPTGAMFMWPTPTAPGGYLLCNGQSVSRTTFPGLFAILSTTFGSVDGNSFNLPNFSDGIFPIGAGASYPLASTVGSPGYIGEANHVLSVAELAAHAHSDSGHVHYCSGVDHLHSMQGHVHNMDHYHGIVAGQFAHGHNVYARDYNLVQGTGVTGGIVIGGTSAQFGSVTVESLPAGNTLYASQTNGAWVNTGGPSAGTTAGSDRSLAFNSNAAAAAITNTGSNAGHNNIPPYLAINFIIKT